MLVEILFGSIGSGKSTYCKDFPNAIIISQDSLGKKGHIKAYKEALMCKKDHIIIDRMNFNKEQRKRYIVPALAAGYQVKITSFFVPYDVALERVISRQGHPTIPAGNEQLARKVLDFFFNSYEYPSDSELIVEVPNIIK